MPYTYTLTKINNGILVKDAAGATYYESLKAFSIHEAELFERIIFQNKTEVKLTIETK
jgi:hypothetical protein